MASFGETWFLAMDSVGKIAGCKKKGKSTWYSERVAESLGRMGIRVHVEQSMGADVKKLSEIISNHTAKVRSAHRVWVVSLGNDLVDKAGRNIQQAAWEGEVLPSIRQGLQSIAEEVQHKNHRVVFGGDAKLWDVLAPEVFR